MNLTEAIYERRAVRHFSDCTVAPHLVEDVIQAAVQAPSALNQQPWAFAVFHGAKRLRDYSQAAKRHLVATLHPCWDVPLRCQLYEDPEYDIFHGAQTLIVIYARPGAANASEDCCMAAQNLLLAAHGLGLGTCPIGHLRSWLDLPETKRTLDVPDNLTAVFPLVLGYQGGPLQPVSRNSPDIVSWKWDPSSEAEGLR